MKRCHDCGNPHFEIGGWCEWCNLRNLVKSMPPNMPKLFPDDLVSVQPLTDDYGNAYDCTFCYDSGINGGCVRCGRGIIEAEDE